MNAGTYSFSLQLLYLDYPSHSVDGIRESLFNVWNNPLLAAHLGKGHDKAVSNFHVSANLTSKGTKRTRKAEKSVSSTFSSGVEELQQSLDAVELKAFRFEHPFE